MTSRRNQNTSPTTKSDYERQLEEQNEQLQKKLADSQRINDYYADDRCHYIKCGVSFVHNVDESNVDEYYTSNSYTHPVAKLWEHGGLGTLVDTIVDADIAPRLTIFSAHVGLYRNGRVVWELFFGRKSNGKWELDGIQLREDVVSGAKLGKRKSYKWIQIIRWLTERGLKYKQIY
jgi:hypothetical protein